MEAQQTEVHQTTQDATPAGQSQILNDRSDVVHGQGFVGTVVGIGGAVGGPGMPMPEPSDAADSVASRRKRTLTTKYLEFSLGSKLRELKCVVSKWKSVAAQIETTLAGAGRSRGPSWPAGGGGNSPTTVAVRSGY